MSTEQQTKTRYFVYILLCKNSTYYVGFTKDIIERLSHHISGKGARYTRTNRPITLMAYWMFSSGLTARRVERAIKKLPPSDKQLLIEGHKSLPRLGEDYGERATDCSVSELRRYSNICLEDS